jgi:hypothetical protein
VRRAALLVASLLAAAGCRTLPTELVPLAPGDERPGLLLGALHERAAERRGLRGTARLAVDSDDGAVHIRGSQVLAIERPARLRVEILGFLNQTEAVLVTDAGRYELFVAGERRYESGLVYPGLLWEVARIDLEPYEVVDLVLGAPVPSAGLEISDAFAAHDGGVEFDLVDASGAHSRRLSFDAEGRLRRVRVRERGRDLWEARFDDYATVAGTPFAHEIAVEFSATASRAELSLRQVELNPELPQELFQLQRPPVGRTEKRARP